MKDREKRINEMSRDMCFHTNCSVVGRCYELNCETTWVAEKLIDLNYQKVDKDSVVLTKAEKEKLLHEMYEQGRFDAVADLEKEDKLVLSREELHEVEENAYQVGIAIGKKLGGKETAEFWHDKIDTALLAMWKGNKITTEQYNVWIVAFNGFAKQFGVETKE